MRRYALRLAFALAAFTTGVSLPAPRVELARAPAQKPEAAAPCPRAGDAAASALTPSTPPAQAEAPDVKTPRIGQRETLLMPGVGRVRVTAFETDGQGARLVFENADSGKQLLSVTMVNDALRPLLRFNRFKAMHFKGLPDPVVVGLAVEPGGSDAAYELRAVAAVGGELKELTRAETFTTEEEGGFYIGDLGHGLGIGLAVWDFVWDEDESHVSPHRYEIKLYKWNEERTRFEWARVLRTPGKFDSGEKAVRSVGLHFKDLRGSIPEFKYLDGEE
ncbi:MAG: hypothetical protein M3348_13605 [Acidobacteriota bacterium]|nr:hypothetical protein [Acidobacteriota bacterium]